jgi:hypothetical protein
MAGQTSLLDQGKQPFFPTQGKPDAFVKCTRARIEVHRGVHGL